VHGFYVWLHLHLHLHLHVTYTYSVVHLHVTWDLLVSISSPYLKFSLPMAGGPSLLLHPLFGIRYIVLCILLLLILVWSQNSFISSLNFSSIPDWLPGRTVLTFSSIYISTSRGPRWHLRKSKRTLSSNLKLHTIIVNFIIAC